MKRVCVMLLSAALLLGLGACGGKTENTQPRQSQVEYVAAPGSGAEETDVPQKQAPEEENQETKEPASDQEQPVEEGTEGSAPQEPVAEEPAPQPEPEPEPQPEPEPEPRPETPAVTDPAAMKTAAAGLVGAPVGDLYAAIGKPLSASYAPSCLDLEADDGELVYDGFIVYTLKKGDSEIVESVF